MYDPNLETTDKLLPFNLENISETLIRSIFENFKKSNIIFSKNDLNKITQKIKSEIVISSSESLFQYVN
jgi:hypothetical protein